MSIISHMGIDYDSPNVEIQDNPSATDLDNTKVPTGQTIKNYINNKFPFDASYSVHNNPTSYTFTAWETKTLTQKTLPAGTYLIGFLVHGTSGFATNNIIHYVYLQDSGGVTSLQGMLPENTSYNFVFPCGSTLFTYSEQTTIYLKMQSNAASSGTLDSHIYIFKIK